MKLYSLPILALLILMSIETNEPTMSVDYNDTVAPGDIVNFSIHIENTTIYPCNDCVAYVDIDSMDDETLAHILDISPPFNLPSIFPSDYNVNGGLYIKWGSDTPNGTYDIPIVFEGTLGECDGGCFPFTLTHTYNVALERDVPKIQYMCNRVCDVIGGLNAELPVTLTNSGAGNANDVKISIYGEIEGYVSPDSFDSLLSSDTYPTTIYINTSDLDPGFYDLGLNIVYYDDYFKLYSENVTFRIQVRPQRPQMEYEILQEGRNIIFSLVNEGGLKAKDITTSISIGDEELYNEMIDEITTTGSVLIPLHVPEGVYGDVSMGVEISYFSNDGEAFSEAGETFINIPKNTTGSDYKYYYALAVFIMAFVSIIVVRKRWIGREK